MRPFGLVGIAYPLGVQRLVDVLEQLDAHDAIIRVPVLCYRGRALGGGEAISRVDAFRVEYFIDTGSG